MDGADTTARFCGPTGIAIDPRTDGRDLLVTDHSSDKLRRVRLTGGHDAPPGARAVVKTLASDLSGIRSISSYCPIADCFYATMWGSNQVCQLKVNPSEDTAQATRIAGAEDGASGSANGSGGEARFHNPRAVEVSSTGEVYVGDTRNHVVRRLVRPDPSSMTCTVTTLCGSTSGKCEEGTPPAGH